MEKSNTLEFRTESDYLGTEQIPVDAYYGIATARALKLFPNTGEQFDEKFIWAYFMIKKSAALLNAEIGRLDKNIAAAITTACDEWERLKEWVVVDPLSGGAGAAEN